MIAAALRTWLRYLVPLTTLSAIAHAPVIAIALRTPVPADQKAGLATLWLGWKLIALALLCQLVLVGAATAVTRARPSQLRAFAGGAAQLARAIVPCLAAAAVIGVASLALVVPGLILLVLLSLTGASPVRGLPGALVDSIDVTRAHLRTAALAVLALIALDFAIGFAAQLALVTVPVPRQPAPAQLAALRELVRVIALALVLLSPLPAVVLATIRTRADR